MQATRVRLGYLLLRGSTQSCVNHSAPVTQYRISACTALTRHNSTATAAAGVSESTEQDKWDLYVGLCLERRPVITKDKTPLEKKYAAFLAQYEVELSKKSDHEIRQENDAKLIERIKKGDVEQANVTTAEDFEEASLKERLAFKPASRVTEADEKNDRKNLERSLQTHLLLAVHQKLGQEHKWILPHMKRKDGQTLREVADKALQTFCPDITARVLGNAPWGFYKYKYPKDSRENSVGAKVFFYKAQVLSGQMALPKGKKDDSAPLDDFFWLTRAELPEFFEPKYFNAVSDILIPEY